MVSSNPHIERLFRDHGEKIELSEAAPARFRRGERGIMKTDWNLRRYDKMAVEKFSISLAPDIMEQISLRSEHQDANRSWTIAKQLDRYFDMVEHNRRELRAMFDDNECALILDTFNGVMFSSIVSVRYAWHEVADAIRLDHLDEKWSVDGPALVEKLKNLSLGHLIALVDSTEIWWNRVGSGEQPEYGEMLTPS